MLAAGLAQFDPEEAYKVALMDNARNGAIDREVALSYVRNAQVFEHLTSELLERTFPAVLDAVGHLDYPPATALTMITRLLNRHGASVSRVMRNTFDSRDTDSFPEWIACQNALLRVFQDHLVTGSWLVSWQPSSNRVEL